MFSTRLLLCTVTATAMLGACVIAPASVTAAKGKGKNKAADKPTPTAAIGELKLPTKALPAPLDATTVARRIDAEVMAKLSSAQLPASPQAGDAEFLRRVTLDITGVIPSADQAAAFLDSKQSDKRAKLIDDLLASSAYGRHMADNWDNHLVPRTSDNRKMDLKPLTVWLEGQFNSNVPWTGVVTKLLTSEGTVETHPETLYYVGNRGLDTVTDITCKLFLGVQLNCAQCHNHPFTDWKQNEYWQIAGFFDKVKLQGGKGNKGSDEMGVNEAGKGRPLTPPEAAKHLDPKFLAGDAPKLGDGPRRAALAQWVTSTGNPFFAKAAVNRVWAQFFGRGLVNPVDDVRPENAASHPELLITLADQFAANKHDLKWLVKAICLSEAYQRSSVPMPENASDVTLVSHAAIKVLSPEQLFDSVEKVLGSVTEGRKGKAAGGMKNGGSARDQFVAFFLADENPDSTKYEAGIPQALRLMNAPQMNKVAGAAVGGRGAKFEPTAEKMYLQTLSRRPTADELRALAAHRQKAGDEAALGDLLWCLLNSSEFALNR